MKFLLQRDFYSPAGRFKKDRNPNEIDLPLGDLPSDAVIYGGELDGMTVREARDRPKKTLMKASKESDATESVPNPAPKQTESVPAPSAEHPLNKVPDESNKKGSIKL